MEQFFGSVNTFYRTIRIHGKKRLGVCTNKVVPFTLSASVLEWVDGTLPLGEYLIRRNGGAHGRYGLGDWSFLRCREHMTNEKDKCKAFHGVSENFRLDWFGK
ncbi:serine/threonine-protein kinase ATM-like isoform X2 [Quercus suber]|uniref:serine/threonine-protein kinase ATM-like isoform X2 n=1 Tax=Quercus suber TaxID=58331 RepID=UPI0032DF6362